MDTHYPPPRQVELFFITVQHTPFVPNYPMSYSLQSRSTLAAVEFFNYCIVLHLGSSGFFRYCTVMNNILIFHCNL